MNEVKPKRGRPKKNFLPSILSDEQVAAIKGTTPEQEAAEKEARERERLRGIERRKQARVDKEIGGIETKESLWMLNRKGLVQQELDGMLQRESRVLDLLHWMELEVSGKNDPSDPDYVSLDEGRADVDADIKQHGVCQIEMLLIDEFWNTDLFTRTLEKGNADSVLLKFGIVQAIPTRHLYSWQQFLVTRTASPSGNGFTTMKCGCGSLPEAVQQSIADRYRELGITYQCQRCRDLERKSRMESTIVTRGAYTL